MAAFKPYNFLIFCYSFPNKSNMLPFLNKIKLSLCLCALVFCEVTSCADSCDYHHMQDVKPLYNYNRIALSQLFITIPNYLFYLQPATNLLSTSGVSLSQRYTKDVVTMHGALRTDPPQQEVLQVPLAIYYLCQQ